MSLPGRSGAKRQERLLPGWCYCCSRSSLWHYSRVGCPAGGVVDGFGGFDSILEGGVSVGLDGVVGLLGLVLGGVAGGFGRGLGLVAGGTGGEEVGSVGLAGGVGAEDRLEGILGVDLGGAEVVNGLLVGGVVGGDGGGKGLLMCLKGGTEGVVVDLVACESSRGPIRVRIRVCRAVVPI